MITGRVVDPSGLGVAGATVTLTNEHTNAIWKQAASDSGVFTFPAVQPDTYSIRVEERGFRAYQRTGTVLSPNERLVLGNLELTIGAVAETVNVSGQGSAVETASAEHAGLVTATQMDRLMVRGRDPLSMLQLVGGVSYTAPSNAVGGMWGSNTPNIEGTRSGINTALVDGVMGSDFGGPAVMASTVNMEAVAEVKLMLNNYPAEFGRNGGAMITMVTKSGGSTFHGTGYWFFRNEEFNATDFFNNRNGVPKSLYRYDTLGVAVGGPLYLPKWHSIKTKLFWYESYEHWHDREPEALQQVTVPTALERSGDFSQSLDTNGKLITVTDPLSNKPFPGNVIPASRINSNGQALLAALFPLPNALNRSVTLGAYNYNFDQSWNIPKWSDLFNVDYHPTTRDIITMGGRLWNSNTQGYGVVHGGPAWGPLETYYMFTDNTARLSYTHIFAPWLTNEFTGAVRHSVEKNGPVILSQFDTLIHSNAGYTLGQWYPGQNNVEPFSSGALLPQATFSGVAGAAAVTYDPRFISRGGDAVFNFADNLSLIRGAHFYKFGVYVERGRETEGHRGTYSGLFNFTVDKNNPLESGDPYANAMLGNFDSYTESSSRPGDNNREWDVEWFAEDTWKVSKNLTFEYGLRFTYYTPWLFPDGKNVTFSLQRYDRSQAPSYYQPTFGPAGNRVALNPLTGALSPAVLIGALVPNSGNITNGMVPATDKTYPSGFQVQQPVKVGPRFGVAYDPTGKGNTAIRAGFGIYYITRYTGNNAMNLVTNPPTQFNPTMYYGNMSTFLNSTGTLFPSSVYGLEENPQTQTNYHASLNVQRNVGFGTMVDIGYVGVFARHLMDLENLNLVPYGSRFLAAHADPTNPGHPLADQFFAPYPGYGSISYYQNAATSSYNALQISVNRRLAHGFQYGLAYTWSKAMDYADSDSGTVATYQSHSWNYGKAGFDQTHVLVINYTWDVPKASKLWNIQPVRQAFDNWQLSGITSFVSGSPLGITLTTSDGRDITGGGDAARVVVTGKAELPFGSRSFSKWFNSSVIACPTIGYAGDAPKDVFRGPGFNNWDMSLVKKIPIRSESRFLQLRAEFYNAFNHTQFATVNNTARFDPSGNQINAQFGQVISTRPPRVGQVSLRLSF
jgi:hypothetical protein